MHPTEHGTGVVKDINRGAGGCSPGLFVPAAGRAFFTVGFRHPDYGRELWVTDGTEGGTKILKDIYPGAGSSEPSLLTPVGGRVFFVAEDPEHGREVWALPVVVGRPRAEFSQSPEGCQPGRRVFLHATASSAGEDARILSYRWDLGGVSLEGARVEYEYPEGI